MLSWCKQHILDVVDRGYVQQHGDVLVPGQLEHLDRLCLLALPAFALCGAQQVDCSVSVPVDDGGVYIWEVCVIEALSCGNAAAIKTVDRNARRLKCTDQRFRVLPHGPAVLIVNIFEEALIVLDCVAGVWGGYQDHVFGPGVGVGEEPDGGDGRSLLGADFYRTDDRNAVVVACDGTKIK